MLAHKVRKYPSPRRTYWRGHYQLLGELSPHQWVFCYLTTMLSIERVLEIVDDKSTTATQAEELRDACRAMAEIIYEKWEHDRRHLSADQKPTDKSLK